MTDPVSLPPPLPAPASDIAETTPLVPILHVIHKHRHISVPLLVPPLALCAAVTAELTHAGTDIAFGGGALAAAVWFFAPHKWTGKDGKPRWPEVWYARLSALAAAGWLYAAAKAGLSPVTLIPLLLLALAWGIPWYAHKRPRFTPSDGVEEWAEWWGHYAIPWNLAGSRVTEVWTMGVQDILRVQLRRGHQTIADVKTVLPKIESALGGHVRSGMIRLVQDKDDPSQVLLYLKREQPLAKPIAWDDSLAPTSILDPAPLGVAESTGEWIMANLLVNEFVNGATRSGKSNYESVKFATITRCRDARVWLIDRKGGRAARPWLPAVDWVATTIEEARLMLWAADAEVRARAQDAYNGTEQLEPNDEVPALFIVLDEAAQVTGQTNGDSQCAAFAESIATMGSGVAVYMIVMSQHGTLDATVRSELTRSSLKRGVAFFLQRADHGQFVLSDWNQVDASKLELPGMCYFQDGPHTASIPMRTPEIPHPRAQEIAKRNGALPRRPLMLFAQDCQQAYDERWSRLPKTFRELSPQYAAWVAKQQQATVQEAPVTTSAPSPVNDSPDAGGSSPAAVAAQIEAEVASTPDLPPPSVPDDVLRGEIDHRKRRFARALATAGPDGIAPRQLISASGMSKSWVHLQLPPLLRVGVVTRHGEGNRVTYSGTSETGIWDAMEGARQDQERLLASVAS